MEHDYIKYLGLPYKFNGNSFKEGFDCINLCCSIAKERKIPLMNINHQDFNQSNYYGLFNLRYSNNFIKVQAEPNVLVVFKIAGKISHVGYMLDKYTFIHIMEKSKVSIEKINSLNWSKRVVGFYKYVGDIDARY